MRHTKPKPWPNNLGFTFGTGRARFEVMNDRAIGRLSALRYVDDEATHHIVIFSRQTRPAKHWTNDREQIARMIMKLFANRRNQWTHYES